MDENPSEHETAEPDPQADPGPGPGSGPDPGPEAGEPQMTEAEREMLEQQMREVRVEDLLTQTVASVLNLSARRIVKEDEIDFDQARIGIEAVRAIVPLLPPEVEEAVREPLSQVQMLYAQRSGGAPQGEGADQPPAGGEPQQGGPGPGGPPPPGGPGPGGPAQGGPQRPQQPGGSGLWTPGSN